MLLSLDSLMKTIAPTTSLHNTARLLVDNLNLTILDNIFVVQVEHGICLQQLLDSMYTFALGGIIIEDLILCFNLLLGSQIG